MFLGTLYTEKHACFSWYEMLCRSFESIVYMILYYKNPIQIKGDVLYTCRYRGNQANLQGRWFRSQYIPSKRLGGGTA